MGSEIATPATASPAMPGRSAQAPDHKLLRAVRSGSPEAAEALVGRHWGGAHRIAYGILGDAHAAEDVAQEAMLSALANLGRFDVYRPFGPWLHRIVSNRALDWLRARERRAEVSEEQGRAVESAGWPDTRDERLTAALAMLSPEHRAVVVLRFVGGYGPDEIARALGMPRGTVGSRLRRALDQLQIALEDEDG